MRVRRGGLAGWLDIIKLLSQRFMIFFVIIISILLMIVGKEGGSFLDFGRSIVSDTIMPVVGFVTRPVQAFHQMMANIYDLASVRRDNLRLKAENDTLRQDELALTQLRQDDYALRQQLNVIPDPKFTFVTARVIGNFGLAFSPSLILNAGTDNHVYKGQAVLSQSYLVGYVAQANRNTSRLLLLNDTNSRIPVILENSKIQAIMVGSGADNRLELKYINDGSALAVSGSSTVVAATVPTSAQVGERVLTAAAGAAFPAGLPVGTVQSIEDGTIYVKPYVSRYALNYVLVIDYGLNGILPDGFNNPAESGQNSSRSSKKYK